MPLRKLILHNFWVKLFSLALATIMWFGIHNGIESDFALTQSMFSNMVSKDFVRVPVEFVTQPGESRVFHITPKEVDVLISGVGDEATLRKAEEHIKVYIDLTNFHVQKTNAMELQADVPRNIKLVGIVPSEVSIEQISP